ncbi:flippase [Geomonas sp. Red32]|uniref:flippase n=1 Tax=Geomonas sp. Red32 TaxID=2912856 RepID=UPI00202CCAAC|nr:flippase [Geomonas sp. Red32]MCM0081364.1 flippase [Geomonas sp. Red32]
MADIDGGAPGASQATGRSWLAMLPAALRSRVEGRPTLQRVLGNMGWLVLDKVLRLTVGLVVGAWIARYLGPAQFGLWNYALAFTALFGAFASLGLDTIVVREMVKFPGREAELVGTAWGLKLAAGTVTLAVTVGAVTLLRPDDSLTRLLVAISAAGFVFQSANVIDLYYQAQLQSRYTVVAGNLAFAAVTVAKIVLLAVKAPLVAFAVVGLGEMVLTSLFLVIFALKSRVSLRALSLDRKLARRLLKESWPMMFSGLAVMIYMRIDQIMLGQMLGDREVGIYSAAVRLSEVWYFVPTSAVTSAFPVIVGKKRDGGAAYLDSLQTLYDSMALLGVAVSLLVMLVSPLVVSLLYGSRYAEAAGVLSLHVWSGIFVSLGVASGSWLAAENLPNFSMYRTLFGGVVNVVLNVFLIPRYGAMGAAYSTLIAYASAVYFVLFFQRTRQCGTMLLLAFIPFKKYLLKRG